MKNVLFLCIFFSRDRKLISIIDDKTPENMIAFMHKYSSIKDARSSIWIDNMKWWKWLPNESLKGENIHLEYHRSLRCRRSIKTRRWLCASFRRKSSWSLHWRFYFGVKEKIIYITSSARIAMFKLFFKLLKVIKTNYWFLLLQQYYFAHINNILFTSLFLDN